MQTLRENMRFLCDETRMLTGISVAYGTRTQSETALYGRAQEVARGADGRFIPCVRPLAEDSLFDLASLTKLFTAVAAMQLVERGALSLQENVGDIDRRFTGLRDVPVGDVMGFTAGLLTPGRIDDAPTREEGLRRLFSCERREPLRVRAYSDINAMVIKYVVEAKTGLPLDEVIRERILAPAGMRETFSLVPQEALPRCVCTGYEHRIEGDRYLLREDATPGAVHDPKARRLSCGGRDLCGHAGLFSTRADMVRFAQALLRGELLSPALLAEIGVDRTGRDNGDGTRRQSLGYLCFAKHPVQRLSEVPPWMDAPSIGLSGFTGNHLSLCPAMGRFVLFLGNRCHARVTRIAPAPGFEPPGLRFDARGVGTVLWPDGRSVPSSAQYVYFKDERLHAPIEARMRKLGWL